MEIGSYWKGWRIDELLGEGAFGKVYKISRREMDFEYSSALKVISIPNSMSEYKELRNQGMDDESIATYFNSVAEDLMIELKIMSRLKGNTNIVSYEDHVIEKNPETKGLKIYIRMELLTPLYDYIPNHPLTEQDIVRLGIDMCKALEVCRKYNIIHRDIKPQNIFVSDLGDFKLGDFGIARRLEKTEAGLSKKGTYSYMAPEVYKAEPYNHTVDIYSLGVVLYNFLNNNRTPFLPPSNQPLKYTDRENANIRRMRGEQIPEPVNACPELADVVLKACAFKPSDRFQSATEFRQALESLQSGSKVGSEVVYDGKTPLFLYSTGSFRSAKNAKSEKSAKPEVSSNEVSAADDATVGATLGADDYPVQPEPKKKNKKLVPIIAGSAAAVIAIVVAVMFMLPKNNNNVAPNSTTQTSTTAQSTTNSAQTTTQSSQSSQSSSASEISNYVVDPSFFGDENNIKLTVSAPSQATTLLKAQLKDFINEYPTINFSSIEIKEIGEQDVSTMFTSGTGGTPDVFSFASDQLDNLASNKYIAELPAEFTSYVSKTNSTSTVQSAVYNSKLYAYPETSDNGYCLIYNKSVVSDSDSATLEGVLKACKSSGKTFVMTADNGFYSCIFAFTGGAVIEGFDSDGSQKFAQYDEDTAVDTLMAFSKLMKEYKGTFVSEDVAAIESGFKKGEIGAGIDGSWNLSADEAALGDDFGAAKLPTINVNGSNKQIVSLMGYKYIGVNSNCSYPRAAQILALYLAGEKCQKERASQLIWGPSNYNAQNTSYVLNNTGLTAIMAQSKNSVPMVQISGSFWTPMSSLGSSIYKDSKYADDRSSAKKLLDDTINKIKDN